MKEGWYVYSATNGGWWTGRGYWTVNQQYAFCYKTQLNAAFSEAYRANEDALVLFVRDETD